MGSQEPSRLVQQLVAIAIIGIFAAIVVPALKQARDRTASMPTESVTASPADHDGLANTIELSEVSDDSAGGEAGSGIRIVQPLIPVAIALVIAGLAIRAAKRGASTRAE